MVEWLRADGHDAVHLRDEGLQKLANGIIFQKALAEQRIVLTFDLDFGEIVSAMGLNIHAYRGTFLSQFHSVFGPARRSRKFPSDAEDNTTTEFHQYLLLIRPTCAT